MAHMRLVLLLVQGGRARLEHAVEVVNLQHALIDSLVVGDNELYLRRIEHWNPAYFDFLGADLIFFNVYLEVIKEAMLRGETGAGVSAALECLTLMNHSHIPGDNQTKSLLFDIVEIADTHQNSTTTHTATHTATLMHAAKGMPDLCDDDIETRTLRKAKRMPHATCFDGISKVDYFAKPLDFIVQEPWLGLKDIDAC